MTEYFRIEGLNLIPFDARVTGAADTRYTLEASPRGMDEPLTKSEIQSLLPQLPVEIRGHALKRGMSRISFPFTIKGDPAAVGGGDVDMEDARHDLTETLEDAKLYIQTQGARGTRGVLMVKANNVPAGHESYKTVYYGEATEVGGREILGGAIKQHFLLNMQMVLYCEPYWRPLSTVALIGALRVYNHDDAGANHDNYIDVLAANIMGDVPAKCRVRITDENMGSIKFAMVARRSQGTVANFGHWKDAETGTKTRWPQVADDDRSRGLIVSNTGADGDTDGNVWWSWSANLADYKGRFGIYAALWTDDIVNTRVCMRTHYSIATKYYYQPWKQLTRASTWQLVRLGDFVLDFSKFPSGQVPSSFTILVEYTKAGPKTIKMDYIMFWPEDESTFRFDGHWYWGFAGPIPRLADIDGTMDYPYYGLGDSLNWLMPGDLKGPFLTVQPGRNNRIYLKLLNATNGDDPYEQHYDLIDDDGVPRASCVYLSLDYLPQYISPLE